MYGIREDDGCFSLYGKANGLSSQYAATAFLISRCDLQNPFSAVWAVIRISRQHRVTIGTAGMLPFVLVKERFSGQPFFAFGTDSSFRACHFSTVRTDLGVFHYIGAKSKVLQIFETQFLCHLNPASLRRSAYGHRRDNSSRRSRSLRRRSCSISVHTQRGRTPHIP